MTVFLSSFVFLCKDVYNIMYEMSCQSRFNARYWMLGAGALGQPRGRVGEGGVLLHWLIMAANDRYLRGYGVYYLQKEKKKI